MAENKHIKDLKIGGVKASTFGANLKNSAVYTIQDVSKDLFPFAYELQGSNIELEQNIRDVVKKISPKAIKRKVKNSDYYKTGKSAYKNARKDIKKGIFNNRKRGKKSSGDFDDFDLDEFGFSFDDEDDSIYDIEYVEEGDTNITVVDDFGGEYVSSTIKKTAAGGIKVSAVQHKQQMTVLSTINDNLTKLVTFQNETTQGYYEQSAQFYANVTELQTEMRDALQRMSPVKEQESDYEYDFDKIISSSGGIDLSKYGEVIFKKNIPAYLDEITSGMFSLSKTLMDPEMIKEDMENFKNNPLGVISASLLKSAIPKTFKKSMEEFNKTLFNGLKTYAVQMNSYAKMSFSEVTDGITDDSTLKKGLKFFFGKLLKMEQTGNIDRFDLADYEKGKVDFDGITRKSIVEVIPMYLRKILATLQGTNDEIIYDYEEGVADWASRRKLKFDVEKRMYETGGNSEAKTKVLDYMQEVLGIKDVRDNKSFLNDLDVFTSILQEQKLPRLNSDDEIRRFKDAVLGKVNVSGKTAFKGGDQRFETILSAFHAGLSPKEKMALADDSIDALNNARRFMDMQQKKLDQTGLSQILSAENLNIRNSFDYKNAIDEKKYGKRVELENGSRFTFIKPVQDLLTDIKRILLEGIVVYDKTNISNKSNKYAKDQLKELKLSDRQFRDKIQEYKDHDNYILNERLKRYEEFEKERIENGQGDSFRDYVDDVYSDKVSDMVREMRKHEEENKKKEEELPKKKNIFEKMFQSPFKILEKGMDEFTKAMSVVFYGNEEDKKELFKTEDGQKLPFHKFVASKLDTFSKQFDSMSVNLESGFKRSIEYLFGTKGANGSREGGILSPLSNMYKNSFRQLAHAITGNKGVLTDGTVLEERDNSLKSMVVGVKNRAKNSLFGEKGSGGGIVGEFKDKLQGSFDHFQTAIFGKEVINKEKVDGIVRKFAPNAIFGGSLGLLGSMFLPGGPLLGMATGSLLSMSAKSGHLATALFGSEETGGEIFGKKVKGVFNNQLVKKGLDLTAGYSDVIKGGGLGLVAGLMLPGGPLMGGLVGSMLGMNKKTGMIDNFLFGSNTSDGVFGRILDKEKRDGVKKFGLGGAGLGLLGSMFLPGGPLLGASIGAFAGIATKTGMFSDVLFGENSKSGNYVKKLKEDITKKTKELGMKPLAIGASGLLGAMLLPGGPILGGLAGMIIGGKATQKAFRNNLKRFLWGDYDPKTGEGRIGQLRMLMLGLKSSIVNPLKTFASQTIENGRYWMEQNVLIPIKFAFKPFTDLGKHMLGKGKDMIKRHILTPITNKLVSFLEPVKKGFAALGKAIMTPIKSFTKMLLKGAVGLITMPSQMVRQYNATHGIGGGDYEHEQAKQKALRKSTFKHQKRQKKIDAAKAKDQAYIDAVQGLNNLQLEQANMEMTLENKRRDYIYNNLTDAEKEELQLASQGAISNFELMKKNFGKSELEKAKNRDEARAAHARLRETQNRIYGNRSDEYSREYIDENGNVTSREKQDREGAFDDISYKTRIYQKMVESKGALDYNQAERVLKREDKLREKTTKIATDTLEGTNKIADNTEQLKGLAKTIIKILAGANNGLTNNITDDLTDMDISIDEIPLPEVNLNKKSATDRISKDIKENEIRAVKEKVDSKYLDLAKKPSLANNVIKSETIAGTVNKDNSAKAMLAEKEQEKFKKMQEESHGFLASIKESTQQTATTLTEKLGGFGKIFKWGKSLMMLLPTMMGVFKGFKDFLTGGMSGFLSGSIKPGGFLHKTANVVSSKGLTSMTKFLKGKVTKEAVKNTFEKTAIGKGVAKFLNLGPVKSLLGSKAAQGLSKVLGNNIVKKLGSKAIGAAGRAILKAPLTAAFVTTDLISGASEAKSYFKIPADGKVTGKMRIAASVGKALANNLLFGLLPPENVSNLVYKLIASDKEEEKLAQMQDDFYAEAETVGLSADEYNDYLNAGFVTKAKRSLFGDKDEDGNYKQKGWLNPFSWFADTSKAKNKTAHLPTDVNELHFQDTVNINTGNGRGRGRRFISLKPNLNGRGIFQPARKTSGFISGVANKLNPLKAIKDNFSNPLISELIHSLKPLYGNASAIIAPALLGLTLSANDRILKVINKVNSISTTESSQSNNVASQFISKNEEKKSLWGTVKSVASNIGSSIKNFLGIGNGSGNPLNGKGGNNRAYTGRGTNNGHTYFSQLDPKWSNKSLSNQDDDTIGSAGCGPTAVAMALKSRGVDTDPLKASAFASSYKVKNEGVSADFVSDYGAMNGVNLTGRTVDGYSTNDIDVSLASGQPVVALGKSIKGSNPYTSAGHYVTISGKDANGNYLVSDPLNANNNKKSFSPSDLLNNTSAYWTDSAIDGSSMDLSSLMGYGLTYSKVINPNDGEITSKFGPRVIGGETNNHTGIDYGTKRQENKNIYAVADGTVIKTTNVRKNGKEYGYGVSTRIKHPDGTVSIYGHLNENFKKEGDQVKSGERIGLSGNTGWSTGPHLHFEMRDANNNAFDPLPLLEQGKLPTSSEVIENPNNFERTDASKSSGGGISDILGKISKLFTGLITGDFGEGDESSSTDTTTAASNTSGASAYSSVYKDLNWMSKTTGQKGDGPLIEMAARFETGGADVGKISSGSGDYGGKSYGLPQYTYKANGVAGEGSLKTYFMNNFMAKNKDKYPNVWKALSAHQVYSQSFDNAWRNLANTHYDEFYNAQSDSAVQQYYQPIRTKLEAQGYEVGRQPKAIHSAILSRGIQVFNRTHDTLFPEAFKRLGMSAKDASNHPSKVLNALYQVQLDKTDTMFRSSSSKVRNSLRNNRFSLTNPSGEFAYANEILSRELNGDIYRPEEKKTATSTVRTSSNDVRSSLQFNNAVNNSVNPTKKLELSTGRGLARKNKLAKFFGRGGGNDSANIQLTQESPSVTLNNYMAETSSKISNTMALDYITQNMNLALEQVISLLSDIREASVQTATNTKTIAEREPITIETSSNNMSDNSSSTLNINDNRKTSNNQTSANRDFFLGNMSNSSSDTRANLKRKILQIAQG